jgi:hypothetical protein
MDAFRRKTDESGGEARDQYRRIVFKGAGPGKFSGALQ